MRHARHLMILSSQPLRNMKNTLALSKIAENIVTDEVFKLFPVSCKDVVVVVKSLNISKATTSRNIPTKIFKKNFDVC